MEIAANRKDVSFNENMLMQKKNKKITQQFLLTWRKTTYCNTPKLLNIVVFRFCDGKMTKTNLLS